ncbi:MAG TPA: fumarylacetoacetate hydrolase family protein, partial [Bryobacteraceae bacterium]
MRLATIADSQAWTLRPALESPDGSWFDLRDLFRTQRIAVPSYAAQIVQAVEHLDELAEVAARWPQDAKDLAHPIDVAKSGVHFLPPIPAPRTFRDFYAFEAHVAACRARRKLPMEPGWYEQPVFYFSNPVALVGHQTPICGPRGSNELDYELELGLVIGRGGRDIAAGDAWDHVAGFTLINDFSARDLQRKEMAVGLGPAKGKDFATAVGPSLVTLDALRDRIDSSDRLHLRMTARVNGRELSRGDSSSMYFTWPQIIEHASADVELLPGDLVGSGTVGTGCILELGPENTGGWLKPGDVVELEIERLGVLSTPIVARVDHPNGKEHPKSHTRT